MADDSSKMGMPRSSLVSADEVQEISQLARKFNMTADHVRRAMRKAGGRRAEVERELDRLSATFQPR